MSFLILHLGKRDGYVTNDLEPWRDTIGDICDLELSAILTALTGIGYKCFEMKNIMHTPFSALAFSLTHRLS